MNNLSALQSVVRTRINELNEQAEQLQRSFNGIHDRLISNKEINSLEFDIETEFNDGDVITYITKAKLNGKEIFGEEDWDDWDEFIDNNEDNPLVHDLAYIGEALIYIYNGETISEIILTK